MKKKTYRRGQRRGIRRWNVWLHPGVKVFATNAEWITRARERVGRFTIEDEFRVRTHDSVPHDQMIVTLQTGSDPKPWQALSFDPSAA